ncbi:MAG TPA: DUF1702 family protein [Blastocatellia bacterium]|jgi:hypothetical protein|nr:DUF1702 family protein [Blastocatellia bacterium]
MSRALGRLRKLILGISEAQASFARRGFRSGEPDLRRRLEKVGRTFVHGYNMSLVEDNLQTLAGELDLVELEFRGFAFEGAAMGLALLDYFSIGSRNRFRSFLDGPGQSHAYMLHVGAGWALARLPLNVSRFLSRLDPLLGWLALDGYGFHEGYFKWKRSFEKRAVPGRISGYAVRAFDQGLGRSLWFVGCADLGSIVAGIGGFPSCRRGDLWSGIGLACAYAGGANRRALYRLRDAAGPYTAQVAQGAAFAAKARERAANPAMHTELACEILCGLSAEEAAAVTDLAIENLSATATEPVYEMWRQRIQTRFAKEAAII